MSSFVDSPIEEIKQRLNIVDVIQEYLPLKKAGANYRALCPFHHEKTPSFMVSPEKQIWHCFGCSKGGNIFDFVMEIEGMEFVDALRNLARKAGVTLKKQDPHLQNIRNRMYEINEAAQNFFHKNLIDNRVGRFAFDYLKSRGLNRESVEKFKIGYAPPAWEHSSSYLTRKGFKKDEIQKAGLTIPGKEGRDYDRFRDRLMFPIWDIHGNVVGFGGRILRKEQEKKEAKYINTPETPIYHKGRILYGLDKARIEIRKNNLALIVEGYTDVIASHQAQISNVVASSGTALTPDHLRILKRYTENLAFAFDADEAGTEATRRAVGLALEEGFLVDIIEMPEGKDPADVVVESRKTWKKLIESRKPYLDYYFDKVFATVDLQDPRGKRKASQELLPLINKIGDAVLRGAYLKKLAEALDIEEKYLYEALRRAKEDRGKRRVFQNGVTLADARKKREEKLMGLMFKFPEYLPQILDELQPRDFNHEEIRSLYKKLREDYHKNYSLVLSDWKENQPQDKRNLIDVFILEIEKEIDDGKIEKVDEEIKQILKQIKIISLKEQIKKINTEIQKSDQESTGSKLKYLSQLLQKLSNLEKA